MTVNFRGYVFNDAGAAVEGATVKLLDTGTSTAEATFSGGTDSNGLWYFAEADQGRYDVEITQGSSVRRIRWDDQISLKEIDVRNNTGEATPAATFSNITSNVDDMEVVHFRALRGTGAADDNMFFRYYMNDDGGNVTEVARMTVNLVDAGAATEDAKIIWSVVSAAQMVDALTITSSASAVQSIDFNQDSITFGTGTAATDITLTFDAESADGVITWMEDEDYFKFSDDILMNSTEKIIFYDTAIYIYSSADGQLDLVADTEIQIAATTIDINGAVAFNGALTGITNITISGTLSDGNYTFDTSGNVSGLGTVASGAITSSGIIKTDDATEATSTTDGSLQTDGGLSVVKDAVFGDDVFLLSDGAVFNMGAGNDFTITHDGTQGATLAGTPITVNSTGALTLDSSTDITLDADGADVFLKDGGTLFGTLTNSSGELVIKSSASGTTAITMSGANVTVAGDLTISGDDLTMGTNTDTAIMVADGTNYNPVVPSGDVGLTNAGVFSISSGVIVNADVNASAAIAVSKLALTAGDGLTISTNDMDLDASLTTVTTLKNTSLVIGRDADNDIDFATDNTIILRVSGADEVELVANVLEPVLSDGVALGTGSLMWSDLFLASGSVINFNSDDVTLTHSSNTLTVAGGTLAAAAITGTTIDASTDFTIGTTVITDDTITFGASANVLTTVGNLTLHAAAGGDVKIGDAVTLFLIDGGLGNITLGDAGDQRYFFAISQAYTSGGSSAGAILRVDGALTGAAGNTSYLATANFTGSIVTQTATENIANIAQMMITEPPISDNLTGDITRASTLLIDGLPAEGETNYGLMIDGGATDKFYFGMSSSDVATGLSTITPGPTVAPDDFFTISRMSATQGGVLMQVLSEGSGGANQTLFIDVIGGTAITTDVVGSGGQVNISVGEHDQSNGLVDMAATANIFTVGEIQHTDGARLCRLLLKANGVLHLTNSTLQDLDNEDDAQIVRAMQREGSDGTGHIESQYDNPFYSHQKLIELGLAGEKNEDGDFLFPLQNVLKAHEGAMWQTYIRVRELEEKLAITERKLAAIGAA